MESFKSSDKSSDKMLENNNIDYNTIYSVNSLDNHCLLTFVIYNTYYIIYIQ
jgi:hypothetical protein